MMIVLENMGSRLKTGYSQNAMMGLRRGYMAETP
jgi:hypothetical protein